MYNITIERGIMTNIVNVIILLFILAGGVIGFKRGFLKEGVSAIGTILVLVLAFILKNPISEILYTNLPFLNFGILKSIPILNVLIYEALAFLIIYVVLELVLKLILKVTGLVELILKATIILSIPSKILGLLFGLIEYYFLAFVVLSVLSYFPYTNTYIMDSSYAVAILDKTPVLPEYSRDVKEAANEIYDLWADYEKYDDKNKFNQETLEIVLKYDILKPETAEKLVSSNKLQITGANEIIDKYKEENNG